MTSNNPITIGDKVYDLLTVCLASAPAILMNQQGNEELGVRVNLTFTPYRSYEEEGVTKIELLHSHTWSELHSDVADGTDMIALQSFGKIRAAIQEHINLKNY